MDDAPREPGSVAGPALFAVAAAVCVFFAYGLIARPVDDLVGFVSDDAFYYLQTARNLAATGRPTFDGSHATNGFHPGWMAVTTLLAKVFDDRETLLRAALWTSFAIHLATAGLLVRVCGRFVSATWAWVLGALWAVNPLPITLAMQGVEAPLHLFALTLTAYTFTGLVTQRPWTPGLPDVDQRHLVRFGAALGFLFWARTDAVLVVAVTLPYIAVMAGRGAALRVVGIVGGVFALCTLPWFAWSWLTVGSLVQDSGAVKMLWADAAHAAIAERAEAACRFVAGRWTGLPTSLLTASPQIAGWIAAAALAGLVAFTIVRGRIRREPRGLATTVIWLLASATFVGLVYGAYFADQMLWYFGLPGLALFLVGTLCTADSLRRISVLQRPALHAAAGAAAVVGAIVLFGQYSEPMRNPGGKRRMPFEYPWQRDVLTSQRAFDVQVPPNARIGCFNAGIPAYFGAHTVVNLDGLVNHDVDVYRRGELARWLAEERIEFIADEPKALGRAQSLTKEPIRLTVVTTSPLHGWLTPTRFLWRVEAR
jgi:hypothetical protein